MTEPTRPAIVPACLSLVMCDNILQDAETKKYYLMGTATMTYARSFPARYQKLCLYVVLTGIHEPQTITIKLVHLDTASNEDRQVMSISGNVDAPDPLAVAELTFAMRNLPFPPPGEYRFQLMASETLLAERKFVVKEMKAVK